MEGVSDRFMVERDVKQGSVLSPTLFLLVLDPLLKQLQASGLGLSVNQYYAGSYLHADKFHWTSKLYATLIMGNRFLGVQISIIWVVFAIKTVTLLWQPAKAQDIARDFHSSTLICC